MGRCWYEMLKGVEIVVCRQCGIDKAVGTRMLVKFNLKCHRSFQVKDGRCEPDGGRWKARINFRDSIVKTSNLQEHKHWDTCLLISLTIEDKYHIMFKTLQYQISLVRILQKHKT